MMHATDALALADRRARFSERIRSAAQAARRAVGPAAGPPTSLPRATATGPIPTPRRERIEQPLGAAGQPGTAPSVAALLAAIALYVGESTVVVGVAGAEGAGPGMLSCVADGEYGFSALIRSTARALADLRPLRDTPPVMLCIRPPFHVPCGPTDWPSADLVLDVAPAAGALAAWFDPDRLERATVAAMLRRAAALLERGTCEPACPVRLHMALDADEARRVIGLPDDTGLPAVHATLTELYDDVARRYPSRPAIADARGCLSHRELADSARRLAGELAAIGATLESRVGILLPRGDPRWVVACLGVLYAGAAWVPLDPDTPGPRAETLFRQAGVGIVVTDGALADRAGCGPWTNLDLDAQAKRIASRPADRPAPAVRPGNAAYCIFTSGSTGSPRAVVVEHASVVNFARSLQALFEITPEDRVLQYASPGFDVWVQEVFTALLAGASAWTVGDEERLSIEALSRALENEQITIAELPPVLMDGMDPGRFSRLRVASVGGEPFAGSLIERWSSPGCRVVNGYGPTEATVGVIYKDCSGIMRTPPPIGRPVGNHRAYVLDKRMRPVPPGAVGELYLAGSGLARGYLGDAAATASRFLPDPFGAEGGRLYRTGDLVRFDAADDLVYIGRTDRQVKVRGQRAELGEIEFALHAERTVRSAVAGLTGEGDQQQVVAFVVAEPGERLNPGELRARLAGRLPGYMVPGRLVEVPEIPVSANGKADLRTLLASAGAAAANGSPGLPRGRLYERCVVRAMPDLDLSADTSLFQAGASSLQVIRLTTLVRQEFGVSVPVREFLREPTLLHLEALIEKAGSAPAEPAALPRAPRAEPQPLAPGQRDMWFADCLATGKPVYHIVEAHRLRGPLLVPALRSALDALVARHEALRTAIRVRDGVPYQSITAATRAEWAEVECPEPADLDGILARCLSEPFDLSSGRMLRATLIRLGPEDHVLCLVMHHLVSDGRSTEVLFDELGELYTAFAASRPPSLPDLPVQYADFAWWQDRRAQGSDLDDQLRYWLERLADAPAEAELPLDRPRPATAAYLGAVHHFELDQAAATEVHELSRSLGMTPFIVLLTVFAALLARYSRSKDLVVGTPVANRAHGDLDGVIGYLSNMVALRLDCRGDPSFRHLLSVVSGACHGAFANQELPFGRVVDALAASRDLSRHPVIQVTFQVYDVPGDSLRLPKIDAEPVDFDPGTCQFDLSAVVQASRDGRLRGMITYNTELFEARTIEWLSAHFRTLLSSCLASPGLPLSRLEIYPPGTAYGLTGPPLSPRETVKQIVERQAQLRPDAVAISSETRSLSYAETNAAANRLAHKLIGLGAAAEQVVGVCLGRGTELVLTLLAVLKSGAAYVPIDPGYPVSRKQYMIANSGATIVVTDPAMAADFAATSARVVTAEDLCEDGAPVTDPEVVLDPDNLACVMYTSGSTGQPKGAAISHRAIVRLVQALTRLGITEHDTFLQFASAAFDAATLEIWPCLTHGARLAVCRPGHIHPGELGAILARQGVTVMWLTSQLANLITDIEPQALKPLRLLMTGGEALSPPHIRRLQEALPGLTVINGYGPTETTVFATTYHIGRLGDVHSVPIGRPIAGTHVYILDIRQQPVPEGAVGELCVGGPGVGRGYIGSPALTADRFVPDPFGETGSRLYRTGDLARLRPDGFLEFEGRLDDQVKLRGFRIEPGEIAASIRQHPAVRDTFVTRAGEGFATDLVAYVVGADSVGVRELREYLRERLPQFMIPAAIVMMDELPLTSNGKINRRALPRPDVGRGGQDGHTAPRTRYEIAVSKVWQEVIGVSRVGVFDDFFALGGNSLRAAQVTARVAARTGVSPAFALAFSHSVLADYAREIASLESAPGAAQRLAHHAGPAPLSNDQRRLWMLDLLHPGTAAYNIPLTLHLRGELDADALKRALRATVDRHAVLRSRIVRDANGWPLQVAEAGEVFTISEEQAGSLSAAVGLATANAAVPFDLSAAPLIRASLIRISPAEHVVALTVHHIAFDGGSSEILLAELQAMYRSFLAGTPSPLPPLGLQFSDFAAAKPTGSAEQSLGYWRRRLSGLPRLDLPTARPHPPRPTGVGRRYRFRDLLSAAELARMSELCVKMEITEFICLLAAFQATLAGYTGQTDIAVGTPVSLREGPELEPLIGFFANTMVLRADMSGDPDFREMLARVRETALIGYTHRHVPFDQVVSETNPRRASGESPLFQVIFYLQDLRERAIDLPGLEAQELDIYNGTAKFDLDVALTRRADTLSGYIEYNTDVFDPPQIDALGGLYAAILPAALRDPGLRLSKLIQPIRRGITEE